MLLSRLLERIELLSPCPAAEVTGVTGDSKAVSPGDVFVCMAGARFDGHDFAAAAAAAGAAAVVAEKDTGLPNQVLVRNSRDRIKVRHVQFGIANGLGVNGPRLRSDRLAKGLGIPRVHELTVLPSFGSV